MRAQIQSQAEQAYNDMVAQTGTRVISFTLLREQEHLIKNKKQRTDAPMCFDFEEKEESGPQKYGIKDCCGGAILMPGEHTLGDEERSMKSHIKGILQALIKETSIDISALQGPPKLDTLLNHFMRCSSLGVLPLLPPNINQDIGLSAVMMQPKQPTIDLILETQLKPLKEATDEEIKEWVTLGIKVTGAALIIPHTTDIKCVEAHVLKNLNDVVTWVEKLYGITLDHIDTVNELSGWFSLYFYHSLWELSDKKDGLLNRNAYFN